MLPKRTTDPLSSKTDTYWLRYCHPCSVWTRLGTPPMAVLSFWSRKWIGWWCLAPGLFTLLWTIFNPVFLKKPRSTRNWASKTVLGERLFMNRDRIKIPAAHNLPLHAILLILSSTGLMLMGWSVVFYSVWGVVLGAALAYLGRSWFLDRMVWLYEDMKKENNDFENWDY